MNRVVLCIGGGIFPGLFSVLFFFVSFPVPLALAKQKRRVMIARSQQASKQGSHTQASEQASKQTKKQQERNQASNQASKQANKQTSKQPSMQANKQARITRERATFS